ncbi:MAG TPA: acyltransferase [Candidatus Methylacidiphilales bacterium]|nr:acyltransferase [Candidatus Methylacidiphilales bacterium]
MVKKNICDSRLVHLDLIRGLAALAVCAEHLRAYLFTGYRHLAGSVGLFGKLFYFATGLGHQAVMLFFVLSGYFVGGSVIKSLAENRWSWAGFARRRLTRLYMVLIPALVLTAFWDGLGHALTAGRGYDGIFGNLYHSGPQSGLPARDGSAVFLGNALYLQTILVPVYGSNGPLWSLAYEFWYYLTFPLAMLALAPGNSWRYRAVHLLLLVACGCLLPWPVWEGAVIWLMGCAVFWISRHSRLGEPCGRKWVCVCGGLVLLASLALSRGDSLGGYDLLIGLGFASMLPCLIRRNTASRLYGLVAIGLSDISYTLYVVHFPLLSFLFFTFRPGRQVAPSPAAYGTFLLLLCGVVAYASLLWWLFERRTDDVRRIIERRFRFS